MVIRPTASAVDWRQHPFPISLKPAVNMVSTVERWVGKWSAQMSLSGGEENAAMSSDAGDVVVVEPRRAADLQALGELR